VGAVIPLTATMFGMAGLLRAIAHIPFKHGIVVASVYSFIMLVCAFGLSSMGSAEE
jgi:hypothetical protein